MPAAAPSRPSPSRAPRARPTDGPGPVEPPGAPPAPRFLPNGGSGRPYPGSPGHAPIPTAPQSVFPATTPPAAFSFATAVASYGERYPSRIFEPQLVVYSREQMLSFTATGMPYNTP